MTRDYGEYNDQNRDALLHIIFDNFGFNLRGVLDLGFTRRLEQPTADNLSVYARMLDSENFIKMNSRFESYALAHAWIGDAMETAKAAGISPEFFLKGKHFRTFAEAMFGAAQVDRIQRTTVELTEHIEDEKVARAAALFVCREWIKRAMRREGKSFSREALLDRFATSERFRKIALSEMRAKEPENDRTCERKNPSRGCCACRKSRPQSLRCLYATDLPIGVCRFLSR